MSSKQFIDQSSSRNSSQFSDQSNSKNSKQFGDQSNSRNSSQFNDQSNSRSSKQFIDQSSSRNSSQFIDQSSSRNSSQFNEQEGKNKQSSITDLTRRVSASPVSSNSLISFPEARSETDGPGSASLFNEDESVENPWKVNLKSCNINIKFENFKGEKLFSKDVVTTKVVVPGFPIFERKRRCEDC